MGTLYHGDNFDILRRYVADASVDLVYLDPPFNSAQTYNAFFQEKDGTAAAAQIAPPSPVAVSLRSAQTFDDKALRPHGKLHLDIVRSPNPVKGFALQPCRWVIERSFAWLTRCRRLLKDYERLITHSAIFIHLAFAGPHAPLPLSLMRTFSTCSESQKELARTIVMEVRAGNLPETFHPFVGADHPEVIFIAELKAKWTIEFKEGDF